MGATSSLVVQTHDGCCAVLMCCCCWLAAAGGLFDIMAPSFGVVDLHLERAQQGVRRR